MSRVDLWVWPWEEERYMPSPGALERASGGGRSGKAAEGSEGPRVQEPAQHGPKSEAGDVNARAHGFKSPQSWSCTPPSIPPQCPAPVMQSCSTSGPAPATKSHLIRCSVPLQSYPKPRISFFFSTDFLQMSSPLGTLSRGQVPLEILKTVM